MDTIEKSVGKGKRDVGENIRQLRRMQGMNQRDLAEKMHVTQQTLSNIENSEDVDDATLERVAQALGIPAEIIKNYDHERTINYIVSDNTITAEEGDGFVMRKEVINNTNPLDKVTELYERLLSEQKEKYEDLKKQLDEMASELINLKNRK